MKDHLKNKHSENGDEQESQNPYMKNLALSILSLVTLLLLAACNHQPTYPQQLVEADSAMRWGRYNQADSLLQAYGKTSKTEKNTIRRYHQLLTLESKFLHGQSSLDDLLLADSLREFYESSSKEKHAKTLAILGDIYFASSDYPSALEYLLKAEEEAERAEELWLQGIICNQIGDIYLDQSIYDKMEAYFRYSYGIATRTKDTLRMAIAAHRLGLVYTYLNEVDSVIFFYEKARSLAENLPQKGNLIPYINSNLADVYMQLEQFDKAAAIMPHDSLNYANWGYWHYYQNHVDSAIAYFQKSLGRLTLERKSEVLHLLAELEEKRGNARLSLAYAKKNVETEDSIKTQSQVAATLQTEAQHKLELLKNQLYSAESSTRNAIIIFAVITSIIVFAAILTKRRWIRDKAEKEATVARERMLRQEEKCKHQLNEKKILENNREITRLNDELKKAQLMNNTLLAERLKLDAEKLKSENEHITSAINRRTYLMEQLQNSDLYQKIKLNAGKEKFHLTDDEWQTLATGIDKAYDNFTGRLLALAKLDDVEMKVCYLVKMEISPSAIATMLFQTRGAITMKRMRMHEKLLHVERGNSKEFDQFILDF